MTSTRATAQTLPPFSRQAAPPTARALLRTALLVFALALAVRWIAVVVLQPSLGDYVMDSYDVMGQNLLDGLGFSYQAGESVPSVTRAPFYPLWWAALLAVFGRAFMVLRLAEASVDAVTAALVVFMTGALLRLPLTSRTDERAPVEGVGGDESAVVPAIAGLLYAVQPFSIYYSVKMGSETWFTLGLVLFIWCFAAWWRAPSYGRSVLAGVVLGMLVLNKSTAIGLLALLALIAVVSLRRQRASAIVGLGLCVVVVGLIVAPWLARDYRVTGGRVVLVQTLTWWNFWADFDFSARGYRDTISSRYEDGGGHPYSLTAEADVRQEEHLRKQAVEWVTSNPGAMLRKMSGNLLEFWYLVEGVRRSQITAAGSVLQLAAAGVGAWLAWRAGRRRLVVLVIGVILYFNLVYTPIKSVFHYSLVVVPLLCLLQAWLIAWIVMRRRQRRGGETWAAQR